MTNTLTKNAEQLRQNRTARAGNNLADVANLSTMARLGAGMFLAGSPVFDTVSGLDAEVASIVRAPDGHAFDVELVLSDGRRLMRRPELLIVRPTPPAASR